MAVTNLGRIRWGGGREKDMHRTYWVRFLIQTTDPDDGPQIMTYAAGLPTVGDTWTYGNDNDVNARCLPTVECETVINNEPNYFWILKYVFTTRPFIACATVEITTPLSEPDRINGSFINEQKLASRRRDGTPILSSSLEPIYIPKDYHRPTVSITQTVLDLQLPTFSSMINTLNDATLWGLPPRCVKLRNVPWRRLVWGVCTYYYERTLEFDIRYFENDPFTGTGTWSTEVYTGTGTETTTIITQGTQSSFSDINEDWDESFIADVGHRVVNPKAVGYLSREAEGDPLGAVDRTNPANFIRIQDSRGNLAKSVLLDGNGEECKDPITHKHFIDKVELYEESNFLLLGVPSSL